MNWDLPRVSRPDWDAIHAHIKPSRRSYADPGAIVLVGMVAVGSVITSTYREEYGDLAPVPLILLVMFVVVHMVRTVDKKLLWGYPDRVADYIVKRTYSVQAHVVNGRRVVFVGRCKRRDRAGFLAVLERVPPGRVRWDCCDTIRAQYRDHGELFVCSRHLKDGPRPDLL